MRSTSLWQLPAPPLRGRWLALSALAIAATAAAAWLLHANGLLSVRGAFVALTLATIIQMLAIGGAGTGHPFACAGIANQVTTARTSVLALAAGLLVDPSTPLVAWLVVAATVLLGFMDGVDGWVARRSRMTSPFGARYDMETDALFILVLSAHVWLAGKAGVWVLACGLMRYAFVAAGWCLPWLTGPLTPTMRGKAVAVLQFVGLGTALAPIIPVAVSTSIAAVALTVLVWSFAIDVRRLWLARPAMVRSRMLP